jgi:D-alanyl-D-alanine carboxypeptidase
VPLHPSGLEAAANGADKLNASLVLNLVLAAALAQPLTPPPALDTTTTAKIDAIVTTIMQEALIPGASIAIERDGAIVYARGYGVRDLATNAPVDANTIFRFGSVTKEFTAALAMKLVEQHRLATNAMLATWLPDLPHGDQIRLSDLLGQTTGYRDYYPLDYTDDEMTQPRSVAGIISEYASFPLSMTPDTRWEYSNTNYTIAGALIEHVSGEALSALLQRYITGPAGMTNTFFDEPKRDLPDRATGYDSYWTEPLHEDTPEQSFWLNTAGSLAGTASDLARFDIAFMARRLVSDASYAEMTTARTLQNGKSTNYGYGLGVGSLNGHRIVSHGGNVIGYASSNMMAPDDHLAVVVLTSNYEAPAGAIASRIMSALLPPGATPTPAPSIAPMNTPTPGRDETIIRDWLAYLRDGALPAQGMTPDWRHFLTPENRARAKSVLQSLGATQSINVRYSTLRGGFEVTGATVTFANGKRTAALYKLPNGDVAQLFLFSAP